MDLQENRYGQVAQQMFVDANQHLIDMWDAKTDDHISYLSNPQAPTIPGTDAQEQEFMAAVYARLLHNTALECLGSRGDDRQAHFNGPDAVDNMFKISNESLRAMGYTEATTPTKTTAWSGATNLPMVLGYVRKILPRMFALRLVQIQPLDKPTGRYFSLHRNRHEDGTDTGAIAARAGWSYRSWVDDPGEATSIVKSINFTMTSDDVSVTSHKIQTETSIEVEQDLRAYHGMDAMALISDGVAEEVAMELDERILYRLYRETSVNGAGTFQFGTKPSTYTWEEYDRRILELLQRANDHVFTYKRVEPNNLVVGTEVAAYLARLDTWVPTNEMVGPNVITRPFGTLASAWNCFKAVKPWPNAEAIMVYKGTNWTDASFIYTPYVPIMLTGEEFLTNTQVRRRSWLSRDNIVTVDAGQGAYIKVAVAAVEGLSYPAWTEYVS
jgi:hypothetical protein